MPEKRIIIDITDTDQTPQTPHQLEVAAVSSEASRICLQNIEKATTLADYLRWNYAHIFTGPSSIDWIWDYDLEKPTAQSILSNILNPDSPKFEKEEAIVKELQVRLALMENKPETVKIALKRVRDKHKDWKYRCLAIFPKNSQNNLINDPNNEVIVYFEPQNACTSNACDDLFKASGETNHCLYLPDLPYETIHNGLVGVNGVVEYKQKNPDGSIVKQSDEIMILATTGGIFSNEILRYIISNFKRNTTR